MKVVTGGITAVTGILAAGMAAGIKKGDSPDLALIVSERDATVAGVFTTNAVVAPPLLLDRQRLRRGKGRAIIVNSGNANACTGRGGYKDAVAMAALTASALGIPPKDVYVGSTGVIGKPLPMEKLEAAIPLLAARLHHDGGEDAARAIMTTDTTVKTAAVSDTIGGRTVTVGGIAKGSGMIHPNMATMLAYLATDAQVPRAMLQRGLRQATEQSFNRIPVDGDTSTNDMVLCLANGMAGNRPLKPGSADARRFQSLLDHVCLDLAKKIAWDGEGATKFVELRVKGARTQADALRAAVTIATSSLVKTAWFGEDANWGRIMAALGRSGARIAEGRIAIMVGPVQIVRRGMGLGSDAEAQANAVMKAREFSVTVALGSGDAEATVWTTDLAPDYIKINASYRS
ncbi:MAG: bifunctional glutamate N-acetyltransferase/amino-acid acetyltransferase ArgJ [Nitrospirae bacterium]|nr:MAG: bifunctional glutamate N-acetyltransferase/amino-acid acetyltransferase ArgJ [Nitrospirota bacterium]